MSQANIAVLISLLAHVDVAVDADTARAWTEHEQEQAEDWAIRTHMRRKSPSLYVPEMPMFLQPFARAAA